MSVIDGRTRAWPTSETLFHAGTRRQAEVAAQCYAEKRGTVSDVYTREYGIGEWISTVVYHPWV